MKKSLLLMAAFVVCFGSCTDTLTNTNDPDGVPEGMVRLQLYTNADDYSLPVTRTGTANEALGTTPAPWVLVFRGAGTTATFFEAAQSTHDNGTGKTLVFLTMTTDPSRILVIANPPTQFFNGTGNVTFDQTNLDAALTGKTLAEAEGLLMAAELASPQITVPYTSPKLAIPMSGIYPADGSTTTIRATTTIGTSGGGELQLTRIVAKATVAVDPAVTATGFTVTGAGAANVPITGSLFVNGTIRDAGSPGTTDYKTAAGATAETISAVPNATNPIYLYEAKASEAPALIIKATYNSATCYYKIEFRDPSNSNALMEVNRNRQYAFTITAVTDPGYATMAEAIAAPASNLKTTITVTDLNTFDMISNGQYYLGVSNSELMVYDQQIAQTGLAAFTVSTDAYSGMGLTTNSITATGTGLTVSPATIALASTQGDVATTNVTVSLAATFTTGTVTLKLGKLLPKTIKITRRAMVSFTGVEEIAGGNYVSAVIEARGDGDWLSLSTNGVKAAAGNEVIRPTPGPIYIQALENIQPIGGSTTKRTGAVFYLVRHDPSGSMATNTSGRIKVLASQAGLILQPQANCYMVTTGASAVAIGIPVAQANADGTTRISATDDITTVGNGATTGANLVWTDNANRINLNSVVSAITTTYIGSDGYLVVYPGFAAGNAVVAVRIGGAIKWSWHVWNVGDAAALAAITANTGKGQFMDRNLGATSISFNSIGMGGLQYQWGRKDPFPGPNAISQYGDRTLYNASSSFTIGISSSPSTTPNNLEASIANPLTFFINYGDWYPGTSGTQNDALWASNPPTVPVTPYDPCPAGYHVPGGYPYGGSIANGGLGITLNTTNFPIVSSGGIGIYPARGYSPSTVFGGPFPIAGKRNYFDGALDGNNIGYYWSSTPSGGNVCILYFYNSYVEVPGWNSARGQGLSMRCVRN